MHLNLKDQSVNLNGLSYEILTAIVEACVIWERHGYDVLTITSANDGEHMKHSRHYYGDAVDLRSRNLIDKHQMTDELQEVLPQDYDVIIEKDHIHIEWDPKI
jgi:hypothetical protein